MMYRKLTRQIIKAFYEVYNELGTGFLEPVYESALFFVLREYGLKVERQCPISVYFRGIVIGEYRADLIIEERVLIELKAVSALQAEHEAQTLNYLKATDINLGLLMNFGDKPEFKRFIFERKRNSPR